MCVTFPKRRVMHITFFSKNNLCAKFFSTTNYVHALHLYKYLFGMEKIEKKQKEKSKRKTSKAAIDE
jgi:hypothetical protein